MKNVLKQRLVGALVIVSLGVILWPVVFVDVEPRHMDRNSQLPAMPQLDRRPVPSPEPLKDMEPFDRDRYIALHDAPPDAVDGKAAGEADGSGADATGEPDPKPALDGDGIPIAWVLQVITVSEKSRAEKLTRQLLDEGYKAYHRPVPRGTGTLYRVFVGPVFERARLERTRVAVNGMLDVKAIIVRYVP